MQTDEMTAAERERQKHRRIKGAGLIVAGVVAGGVLAGTLGAAASTASSSTSSSTSSSAYPGPGGQNSSAPVRGDEKAVSASQAATLKAAALKAVPGGTVYRIETDAGDGAYEAHMTKADGTRVTVKFDSNLKVIGVEDGMGNGDPAPKNAPSDQASSTSSTA